jgi:hypothetical protein
LLVGTSIFAALSLGTNRSSAAEILPIGKRGISIAGELVPGDDTTFARVAVKQLGNQRGAGLVPDKPFRIIMFLDSGGGDVGTTGKMLMTLARMKASKLNDGTPIAAEITSIVMDDKDCMSACSLLFAAGNHKLVEGTGRVGVHSARLATASDSDDGVEAPAITRAMASMMKIMHTPPAIIARMFMAAPSEINVLDDTDLESWGADVRRCKLDGDEFTRCPE